MKLYLYQCLCENNRLDKRSYLTQLFELDGTLREECSLITPVIQVQLIELAKIVKANYAYIPDFGRYYYIDDIVGERTGIVSLYMRSDPLMSFREGILDLNVICRRNEYNYDVNLSDDVVMVEEKIQTSNFSFSRVSGTRLLTLEKMYDSYTQPVYDTIVTFVTLDPDYLTKFYYKENDIFHKTISPISQSVCSIIMTKQEYLTNFAKQMLSVTGENTIYSNNPSEAILSVRQYPFDVLVALTGRYKKINGSVKFLDVDITCNDCYCILPETFEGQGTSCSSIVTTSFKLDKDSFRTYFFNEYNSKYEWYYKKNANFQIFLPMYGLIDLNGSIVFDKNVYIDYKINLNTGAFIILLYDDYISTLGTYNGNIGVDVGITKNDIYSQKQREVLAETRSTVAIGKMVGTTMKTAGTAVDVGIQTALNPVSAGKQIARAGQAINEEIDALGNLETALQDKEKSKIVSATSNLSFGDTVGIEVAYFNSQIINNVIESVPILIWTMADVIDLSNFEKLFGRPSKYSGKLSGLNGFTCIGSVHIEFNQLNCSPSSDERSIINNILKSGIILPDPST